MPNPDVDLKSPELDTIPPSSLVARGVLPGGVLRSFQVALAGVLRTVATQRNMKIHATSGLLVMIVGMALPLGLSTRVALLFAVAIVFFAEILNTALEALIDLFVKDFHRLAMLAKDAAAGGVLVLALTTVVVLCEVLWAEWHIVEQNTDAVVRSVTFGVPLAVVELIGLFVVRRRAVHVVRVLVSAGLLAPLVLHTTDPFFALVAALVVLMNFSARVFYLPKT